ncbi:MAG: hypothetical protein ABSH53_10455 [Holophaga sp.]
MAAFPSRLRLGAAIIVTAGLLGLGSGCRKGSSEAPGTATVAGTVTFTRQTVAYDPATGAPTGLNPTGTVLVARNVEVRVFQLANDVDQNGNLTATWRLAGTTLTAADGSYSLNGIAYEGYPTFVELDGVFQQGVGNQATVKVVADPKGMIASTVPEPTRPIYVFREDVNGQPFTDPSVFAADPSLLATLTGDVTVNFSLGTGDTWATTVPNWYQAGIAAYPPNTDPTKPVETLAVGSKILGILDSVYYFSYYYGDPTPSQTPGGVLDLHYHPGITESPRRSFTVYDPTLMANVAWDGTKLHYFGTLAGGPTVDDVWDQGVIFPMLARNSLFGQGKTALFPYGQGTQPTLPPALAPDLAVVEGLSDAMAATLLQTPFVTDLSAPAGLVGRDIRVFPAGGGIYSPAALAAAGWQITLVANGIPPPGDPSAWGTLNTTPSIVPPRINPAYTTRFYGLVTPAVEIQTQGGPAPVQVDINSMWAQLSRLQENHTDDPINLSTIFYDSALIPVLAPFGIVWPGSEVVIPNNIYGWPPLAAFWGKDPDSSLQALPTYTLTMAGDPQVPNPAVLTPSPADVYLNVAQNEVVYGKLDLTQDRAFAVSLTTSPATLPAGLQVEVVADGQIREPLVFDAAHTTSQSLILRGNPTHPDDPARHWIRVRLLGQDPTLVPAGGIQVTVNLVKVG